MFKLQTMTECRTFVPSDKLDSIINALYMAGVCELKQDSSKLEIPEQENIEKLKEKHDRFKIILKHLEDYKPVKQPENLVKSLFFPDKPKRLHPSLTKEQLYIKLNKSLELYEKKILEKVEEINRYKKEIESSRLQIQNLHDMPHINTSLFSSTDNIKVILGTTSASNLEKIRSSMDSFFVFNQLPDNRIFIAVFTDKEETKTEQVLHQVGFSPLSVNLLDKAPYDQIKDIWKIIDAHKEDIKEIESYLKEFSRKNLRQLKLLDFEVNSYLKKLGEYSKLRSSYSFSVIDAWVPQKNMDPFTKTISKITKDFYIELHNNKDAPTLYNNPKIIKPFEMLTNLYSPPKYDRLDPTPILAFSFTLFFGFMLTDFFYGLLLAVSSYLIYKGAGKYNESIRDFSSLLILFGISTLALGMFFGSYFGDFFAKINIHLPMVLDPLRDVMPTLLIALSLGFLHLIIGLSFGLIENIRNKKIKDALSMQAVWIIFMISMVLFILRQNIIGIVLLAISIIMNMAFAIKDQGFISGILSIFSFTGFIGDLFSYSRLMALGIGTAGIALAVNFLTLLSIDMIPYVGIIFAVAIFIVGHAFNMAMNGLGAFIHSARLHFLEFFQKFYEGNGRLYQPFKAETIETVQL